MHPYSSFVIHQNQRNPSRLNSLCDFLNNPQSDQHVSRLGVLEFTQLNSPPVYRTLDHQSLREVVSEDIVITEECSLYGRIVLVENISRGIVEILGWALRIDPSFFEAHIGNKDCSEESMLKVGDTPQTFVTWHYPRAITLEGLQGHVGSEEYVRQLNVHRKVLLLPLAQDNAFDALIQHHCSLSVIDLKGGGWLVLILVDPPVLNGGLRLTPKSGPEGPILTASDCQLFQYGYEDIRDSDDPEEQNWPCSPPHERGGSTRPPRDGLFDDLVYYWRNRLAPAFEFIDPPATSFVYYPFEIAVAEWANSYEAMDLFLQNYQSVLLDNKNKPDNSINQASHPDPNISILTALRRWIMPHITQRPRDREYLVNQITAPPLLVDDYEVVINSLEQLSSALETILTQ
ncbi:hypothetical protein ABHI18_002946 [Aspergillus niger]